MDAEQLALAGEQLVSPYTFHLADATFAMALEKDPKNQRALFYRAFLKPQMTFKGIAKRIKPLVAKQGDIAHYERETNNFPNSPLKEFLFDGKENIQTAAQAQDALVQYKNALIDLYRFLKEHQDWNLVLNLNPFIFERIIIQDRHDSCRIVENTLDSENGPRQMDVECDWREIAQRRVTPADMLALRQLAAGELLYVMTYSTYSVAGIEDGLAEANKHAVNGRDLSVSEALAIYEKSPTLGKLRRDHSMKMLRELGADLAFAWKWASQHQDRLCPSSAYPGMKNRKGHLFDRGICVRVDSEAEQNLALFERSLKGATGFDISVVNGAKRSTRVDAFVWSNNPIQDLRTVLPTAFNRCGKATSFRDNTLGGLFPDGDVTAVMKSECD